MPLLAEENTRILPNFRRVEIGDRRTKPQSLGTHNPVIYGGQRYRLHRLGSFCRVSRIVTSHAGNLSRTAPSFGKVSGDSPDRAEAPPPQDHRTTHARRRRLPGVPEASAGTGADGW